MKGLSSGEQERSQIRSDQSDHGNLAADVKIFNAKVGCLSTLEVTEVLDKLKKKLKAKKLS